MPTLPSQLISCCIEELGLARALGVRDVAAARLHRANMATYHQHRAMYASALIAMSEGSYHAALLETQCVLEAQRRCVLLAMGMVGNVCCYGMGCSYGVWCV